MGHCTYIIQFFETKGSVSKLSEAELGALESLTKNKNLHIISSLIATALNKVGHYFN